VNCAGEPGAISSNRMGHPYLQVSPLLLNDAVGCKSGRCRIFQGAVTIKQKDMWSVNREKDKILVRKLLPIIGICPMLLLGKALDAQDGVAGINEANTKVRGYFDAGTNLMYAVGAILGLIGAVKVYQKWNAGDPDTGKVAAAWFGSCVFLVVVATVIKSFFGI